MRLLCFFFFFCIFFFNDTATTEIYTLSLHDALPIYTDGDFVGSESRRSLGGPEEVVVDHEILDLTEGLQIGRAHV